MSTLKQELVALKDELLALTDKKHQADKKKAYDASIRQANAIIRRLPKMLKVEAARGRSSCAIAEVQYGVDVPRGEHLSYNESLIPQERYGVRINALIAWLQENDLGAMFVYTEDTEYVQENTSLVAYWE